MPVFQYTAHNVEGAKRTGTLRAASPTEATARLRKKGLFPIEVSDAALPLSPISKKKARRIRLDTEIHLPATLNVVRSKQLMILTRQMAVLIRAGVPLLRGLKVLERQEKNALLKKAMSGIAAALEEGSTFADALALYPRIFNKIYINMVQAGEAGGVLDIVMERLASYMEKAQQVRNKVRSAMTYPAMLLLSSIAFMIFLMVAIIPKFEILFSDMLEGRSLPPLTLFIMGVSENVQQNWPIGLAVFISFAIIAILLKRFRFGCMMIDSLKLTFPLFGNMVRMTELARFSRTLGTLMKSGVPVLQALKIVRGTLSNEKIASAIGEIYNHIREGEPIAAPVKADRLFPPIFGSMIEVGEETGELPAMLLKIADLYEDEVDHTVAALSSVIEPLLIVILAVVVGTIVMAIFLPMVSVIGTLN